MSATSVSVSPGVRIVLRCPGSLPYPRNFEVISHPVIAWKSGNESDLEGSKLEQISCMGMSQIIFPVPKLTYSSERSTVEKKRMATLLSTV